MGGHLGGSLRAAHSLRRITSAAALTMAAALVVAAQQPAAPAAAPPDTLKPIPSAPFPAAKSRDTVIAESTPGSEVSISAATTEHVMWVEKLRGLKTVRLDGKQIGLSYDDVAYVKLSKDDHITFIAKKDGKWSLIVDGQARSRAYGRMMAPALGGGTAPVAVTACDGKTCHLVVDSAEAGPAFEDISAPSYDPNRAHLYYLGKRGKKWVVVKDRDPTPAQMDDFLAVTFSPDGEHIAVAALVSNKWTWIVDTSAGPGFEVISWLDWSHDSKRFVYGGTSSAGTGFLSLGKHQTRGTLVVDGRVAKEFEGSGFGGGFTEPFVQTSLVPGLRGMDAELSGLGDPLYTTDDKLVYPARLSAGNVKVFIDSLAGPAFDDVMGGVVFTADSKHFFYVGRRGDTFIPVLDQQPGAAIKVEKRATRGVGAVTITPNGMHSAFEIVRGGDGYKSGNTLRAQRRVVVDGRQGVEYDGMGIGALWVSSDGRHFAYIVVNADATHDRVVFDGLESQLYDWVYPASFRAIDDRTIEFVAKDGGRWVRVTETVD